MLGAGSAMKLTHTMSVAASHSSRWSRKDGAEGRQFRWLLKGADGIHASARKLFGLVNEYPENRSAAVRLNCSRPPRSVRFVVGGPLSKFDIVASYTNHGRVPETSIP
jgi:hypothetical protein